MKHEESPKAWRRLHPICVRPSGLPYLLKIRGEYAPETQERILQVGIVHPDGDVYTVSRPGRHHHVIAYMAAMRRGGLRNTKRQGYVTTHGRWVDRIEGLAIATAANQIIFKHPSYRELYSEDMWESDKEYAT